MIELSKRLIYEPCSLTRVPHLKEDVATFVYTNFSSIEIKTLKLSV